MIQADPALTGRTLRLANTGNAASGQRVTNVADGVARLGTRTVSAIALGFTIVAGNRSGKCRGFKYQDLWTHSLAQAVATQVLCATRERTPARTPSPRASCPRSAGLDWPAFIPRSMPTCSPNGATGRGAELVRLEQKAFVTNHNELGAAMMADWGLSKAACDAVLHHEDPFASDLPPGSVSRQLALILHAASRIADVCLAPSESDAALLTPDVLARCESIGIDEETAATLFDRVFFQWAEWGRLLDIATSKHRKLSELVDLARSNKVGSPKSEAALVPPSSAAGMVAEPENAAQVADDDPAVSSELAVLVADADTSSLQFLEQFLVLSGYQVRSAQGGHEALQAFFETAPQLVIVDASLPDISGLEVCRRIRQTAAGRQAYIIVLTGAEDEEILIRLFDAGADDFITKPFAARPLFARIRASLRVVDLQERVAQDREEIARIHADLAVAHRRLEQDALTDVLTGLPNRRYLIDRLAHDWAAARRGGTPLACMMVDIDRFKSVNDTWGHDVGDSVLRSVAGAATARRARHRRRVPLRGRGVRGD